MCIWTLSKAIFSLFGQFPRLTTFFSSILKSVLRVRVTVTNRDGPRKNIDGRQNTLYALYIIVKGSLGEVKQTGHSLCRFFWPLYIGNDADDNDDDCDVFVSGHSRRPTLSVGCACAGGREGQYQHCFTACIFQHHPFFVAACRARTLPCDASGHFSRTRISVNILHDYFFLSLNVHRTRHCEILKPSHCQCVLNSWWTIVGGALRMWTQAATKPHQCSHRLHNEKTLNFYVDPAEID